MPGKRGDQSLAAYFFHLTALLLCVCLLMPLSSCLGFAAYELYAAQESAEQITASADWTELEGSLTGTWGENKEGSAVYLSGKTLLVSIYVQDLYSAPWDTRSIRKTRQNLRIAAEYLLAESARYGREAELCWEEQTLQYDAVLDVDVNEGDDEAVNREIYLWILQNIDSERLLQQYDADGIGYLLFVKDSGISFASVYYEEDAPEWYFERATLFFYDEYGDPEPPSVIAHEILHLFGAVDLYEAYEEDGVTKALVRYVKRKYPKELMYTVYLEDDTSVYDSVPFSVSPITAYCLGLIPTCTEISKFPQLVREYPACFCDS